MGVLGTGSFDTVRGGEFHRCSLKLHVRVHHQFGHQSGQGDVRVRTLRDALSVLTEDQTSGRSTHAGQWTLCTKQNIIKFTLDLDWMHGRILEDPLSGILPLLMLDVLNQSYGRCSKNAVRNLTVSDGSLDCVDDTTPIGCLGHDELSENLLIILDLVLLQDAMQPLEEQTRKFLTNLRVSGIEVNNRAATLDGVNDVVGIITGKDEPTMLLKLLNHRPHCLLSVLGKVVRLIQQNHLFLAEQGRTGSECVEGCADLIDSSVVRCVHKQQVNVQLLTKSTGNSF